MATKYFVSSKAEKETILECFKTDDELAEYVSTNPKMIYVTDAITNKIIKIWNDPVLTFTLLYHAKIRKLMVDQSFRNFITTVNPENILHVPKRFQKETIMITCLLASDCNSGIVDIIVKNNLITKNKWHQIIKKCGLVFFEAMPKKYQTYELCKYIIDKFVCDVDKISLHVIAQNPEILESFIKPSMTKEHCKHIFNI